MKKLLVGIVILGISASILSGCNTVRGFGQDVSGTGHAISRAAS
jgi:predicted small secreted protein